MKKASWADPARWRGLADGSGCPICVRGRPDDVVAEFRSTWVTAAAEAVVPYYACVVSKHHAVEPYELPRDERAAFWEEAMAAARALAALSGAIKMNYGIHGNVIPHLHLHLWPRFVDDPYDTGWPPEARSFVRTEEDLARMAAALRAAV